MFILDDYTLLYRPFLLLFVIKVRLCLLRLLLRELPPTLFFGWMVWKDPFEFLTDGRTLDWGFSGKAAVFPSNLKILFVSMPLDQWPL